MAAPLSKLGPSGGKLPDGIFMRGKKYVIRYRDDEGRQHWETFDTRDEAVVGLSVRKADISRGEFDQDSPITLHNYLNEWVDRYRGTGKRGFREETRAEYRGLLNRYALRYFPASLKLAKLSPVMVARFVDWLCDGREQAKLDHRIKVERARADGKKEPSPLASDATRDRSDSTVRNALSPLRAALATARREGLIRNNPMTDVVLPHRERIEEDDDKPRPFPGDTMEMVCQLVHRDHRVMFELLAATGVRRSELLALEGRHLALDGERPYIRIRQRVRRRRSVGLVVGPLKSTYARRDLPIPLDLGDRLRSLRTAQDAPVFPSTVGTWLDPDNLADRVLAPACEEAGVEWAGFHTFRHTVATRMFAGGRNAKQVQRWLGHHAASFTLDVYTHLLDDDLGEPLGAHKVHTDPTAEALPQPQAVSVKGAD